jgi:hypothetical protein
MVKELTPSAFAYQDYQQEVTRYLGDSDGRWPVRTATPDDGR